MVLIALLWGMCVNAGILKFSDAYEYSLQNSHAIRASSYRTKSLESQIKRDRAFMLPHINFSASIGYTKSRFKYEKPELIENPFTEPIKLPDSLTEVPEEYTNPELPESYTEIPEEYTTLPEGFDKLPQEQQDAYRKNQQKALAEYKKKQQKSIDKYYKNVKKSLDKYLKKQKEQREKYIKEQQEYREKELKKIEKKNNKILKKAKEATKDIRITKQFKITLTQTIYDRERYKIYQSTIIKANKSKIENEFAKQKLAIKILEHYMNILKTYTKINLYKASIDYHKSLLEFNEKSYKMGLISKLDIMKERVSHKSMKLAKQREKRLLKLYKKQLSVYLGFSNYKLPKLKVWKLNNRVIKQMKNFVKDRDNIYSNLEYQIALANIKYLKMQVQVAKSGHYPKVNLQASYTKAFGFGVKMTSNKEVSLNLSMPIYEGGYTQARIESAKYELLASLEDIKNLKDQIDISYRQYLAQFNSDLDELKIHKQSYRVAKAYLNSVKKGYKKGLNSIIDLFEAKNQMLSVEVDYTQSVYKVLDSYINILILTNRLDKLNIIDRVLG